MKTIIFLGGLYNMAFAFFHSGFWKLWKWDSELNKLTIVNSGIMQILNIQIIYYFILTAVICFVFPTELRSTKLGKWFLIGTSGFWFIRTIQQFIFLRIDSPVLYVLTVIFLLGTILFLIPAFNKRLN
ncbi:MAG: hypothetical protein LBQ60_01310 [Bacteroidales bacterium]|jgi:hypothetical protein|nr:hypothetical protein [Bacteroidales bacterium]